MDTFDEPTQEFARGLSRRQLLGRVGGGLAGLSLASLGLDLGQSAIAAPASISLRDLLHRISPGGCDASQGIRALLPGSGILGIPLPVISIRDVAGRYAG